MKIVVCILICYLNICNCSDFKNLNEHVRNQFDKPLWEKNPFKYDLNDSTNLVLDVLSSSLQHTEKNTDLTEHTCTLSYSPEHNYFIREVTEGNNLIWRCSSDFESAKSVDVVQKNGLTQLVSVKNNKLQLFFKRQKSKFVQVPDLETFTKLEKSLEQPDFLLDKWVELDLGNPVPSRSLFSSDLIYLDGVPNFTVTTQKYLELFRVYDSRNRSNNLLARFSPDTLWTYENDVRCDSLSMYMFDEVVLLQLVLANSQNLLPEQEHKYFKKEDESWHSMGYREFHTKFNLLKSKIKVEDVSLDLNFSTKMENVFYKKSKKLPEQPDWTLYPKTDFHLKKLLYNGAEVSVLEENERFSPLELYMFKKELVLVKAHVWKDKTKFKSLNFKKTNRGFVSVDDQEFESVLEDFRTHPASFVEEEDSDDESDLESSSDEEDDVKETYSSAYFRDRDASEKTSVKFNVKFSVNEKYFRQQKQQDGDFEVHMVTPKSGFLVNLVDSKHGVVWKALNQGLEVSSLEVYFKEGKSKALKLNVVGPNVNKYKYYKFENNKWALVGLKKFYKTLNKDEQSLQVFD